MVRSFFIPQYGQEFFRPERGIFCRWLQEKQIWDYKPGSHLPELPTGIFSLVREKGEELRPRHIADASVQASVGVHFVDGDVFHEDPSVRIDDLSGFLVGEVRSPELSLVHGPSLRSF